MRVKSTRQTHSEDATHKTVHGILAALNQQQRLQFMLTALNNRLTIHPTIVQ